MAEASVLFSIGPLHFNSQMVTLFVLSALLVLVSWLGTRHMAERPSGLQNALEQAVEALLDFLGGIMGEDLARRNLPYLATVFILILLSNYSGLLPLAGRLPGLAAPTSTLSVTAALAICTFFAVQYTGFKEHGLVGYSHHFTKPLLFMAPIFIMEEFIHPLSLSLRLFGNIFGEETVVHEIFNLAPLAAPVVIQVLSLLFGFIQALAFTLLSGIYISIAAGEGH